MRLFTGEKQGRPPVGVRPGAVLVVLALAAIPVLTVAAPAAAASPPPFKVWAPWTAGRTMVVGGPGNYYGENTHTGNDYYAVDINKSGVSDCGEPVRATANGTVSKIVDGTTGYGKYVLLSHGNGYTSRYAHLQGFASGLSVGKALGHGDLLGYIGTTGNSTGCHLHFVIYLNGSSVPPSPMSETKLYDGAYVTSDNSNVPPCKTPTGRFCGEFYDGTTPSGYPQFTRDDSAIDANWGSYGPSSAVGSDNFSIKWQGRFLFTGGAHTFTARADDGIRVYLDGTAIIDDWTVHSARDYEKVVEMTAGYHTLVVEYFEATGGAQVRVGWSCPTPAGSFCAEYYPNASLSGSPVFTATESAVDGAWGSGGPGNGVPTNSFSARWKGTFDFAAGTYTFLARADDGVRVWVDDTLVVDDWTNHAERRYSVPVTLAAGAHTVRYEYYEAGGDAVAALTWRCVAPKGEYCVEYYANQALDGSPLYTRTSTYLDGDWGSGGPGSGIASDGFSVAWSGRFDFAGGDHTFLATADDGIRVWVDGTKVIDDWTTHAPRDYRRTVSLTPGEHEIRVEYFEASGGAVATLGWECGAPSGRFCAEYYANQTLDASPLFTADAPFIRHPWAASGPGNGLGADGFSARWRGTFNFAAGEHLFTARADDGIRVLVDGTPVIEDWREHRELTYTTTLSLTAGKHEVVVEYFESTGDAVVEVGWQCLRKVGYFCAEFFSNKDLDGSPAMTRAERVIDETWSRGGPGHGVPTDSFSSRWKGTFRFKEGPYTFIATGDDGIRVTVDGTPVIDAWKDQAATEYRAVVDMAAGDHEVTVEYYENAGKARVAVAWELRRPDAQIRKASDDRYTGKNVYNTTGEGQERSASVRQGRSTTFWFRLQNDGTVADSFLVKGSRNSAGFRVRYYDEAGKSVTKAVKDGTYLISNLAAARYSERIKVVVTVLDDAEVSSVKSVLLRATSTSPTALVDAVRAHVTALSG